MAQSVSPSIILSHCSARIRCLSFFLSLKQSTAASLEQSNTRILHLSLSLSISHVIALSHSLSQSLAQSVSPSMILSHCSMRVLHLSFSVSLEKSTAASLEQSTTRILRLSLSLNLSCDLSHSLSRSMAQSWVHQWSFHMIARKCLSFSASLEKSTAVSLEQSTARILRLWLSINLSSTTSVALLSFPINGSISQSIKDNFMLFGANSSPVIHEIDQSGKSITLSVNLSSTICHILFYPQWLNQPVSTSMILSHCSTRILCLQFPTSINLGNRSLSHSQRDQSKKSITLLHLSSIIYHIIFHDQWFHQSVHQWSLHIILRNFFASHSRNRSI